MKKKVPVRPFLAHPAGGQETIFYLRMALGLIIRALWDQRSCCKHHTTGYLTPFKGLYSTATQKHLRGYSHWLSPPTRNFALGIQTCWYLKTLKFALHPTRNMKICVAPNAKPQHEPMEYRLRCVPNAKLSYWPCTFHVVCAHFIRVGYPT